MSIVNQGDTESLIGAAIQVHRELGPGYLESVYEKALAHELAHRRIAFERQPTYEVRYRDMVVGVFRPDFVVDAKVVVELKAVKLLDETHFSTVLSYLRASGLEIGLLLNFSHAALKIRRVLNVRNPIARPAEIADCSRSPGV